MLLICPNATRNSFVHIDRGSRVLAHEQTELNTLPVLTFSDGAKSDEQSSRVVGRRSLEAAQMCMRREQGGSQAKKRIPIEASDVACSHLQPLKKVKEKELGVAIQCVRPTDLHQTITRVNGEVVMERSSALIVNTNRVVLSSALSICPGPV